MTSAGAYFIGPSEAASAEFAADSPVEEGGFELVVPL
jgi:hypothetical protein